MTLPDPFRAGRLVSLWDMLKFSAVSYIKLGYGAGFVNALFNPKLPKLKPEAMGVPIPESGRAVTLPYLESMRDELAGPLSAKTAVAEIDRLIELLKTGKCTAADLLEKHNSIHSRIEDELKGSHFLYVEPRDVPYFNGGPLLFGPEVAAKFNLSEDIESAGKCLALGQPTACVFHLMRIMEAALHRLGKVLEVKFQPGTQSWFQICNEAAKAAVNRPAKTAKQKARNAALGAAASHLQTVRLAWRNEVMHPKATYTQEQASEVFAATRTFMTHLAKLV